MDSTARVKPRSRPAHTKGITRCAYTTDGSRLITVGSNNTIRLYKTGFDGEPTNIDECPEHNVAVAASSEFFVVGSEDGTVSLYSLASATFERFLLRSSLPIRDVALSPDGKWCAVANDDTTVKIVNTEDTLQVKTLKEHGRSTKHVSFDPKGSLVTLTCTDGIIYVYSMTSETPELIRKVDGVVGILDIDSDVSGAVVWHPDGRSFAVATPTRDIQVVSKNDWEKQRKFANGHLGDVTSLAWSPNGAMLATAGRDGKVLIWETKTQGVIDRHHFNNVVDLSWHPKNNVNLLSFTSTEGEVFIYNDFVSDQFASLLKLPLQPSPFFHDPLADISGNARKPVAVSKPLAARPRRDSLGSLEDALLDDDLGDYGVDGDLDDFVVDDDGAGYTTGRKRPAEDDGQGENSSKRRQLMQPQLHAAFQPGSTPWRGNRKYLCLNLIGVVWTVDQDSHYTITVEFYDREFQRDFHFTDTYLYDKACLNENGVLFSNPPKDDLPATVFYRPHETWTQRSDWRTELPKGESVVAMSLSDSFVTIVSSANYVRIYTLFGIPYRVYRPKNTPVVTCASWKDYVLTMGNGPVGPDGRAKLLYSIEDIKRDEICQNEDTVALPEGVDLSSVFFSDKGDPCIYDSTGVLLTLLHWRRPSRASWVPLLDTKLLDRLASGRKHESYYPIAVADNKFHCIILKGGDKYPYFPRPLLSEFEFSVPLSAAASKKKRASNGKERGEDGDSEGENADEDDDMDEDQREAENLTQQLLITDILARQMRDVLHDVRSGSSHSERSLLAKLELEVDKTLLKMLAIECRQPDDRGMRALEMVELMRDTTGRMAEAAGKVADRYDKSILAEKIRELGERRVNGMDEDED